MDTKERDAKAHEFRGDQLSSTSPQRALSEFTTAVELFLSVASNPKAPAVQRTRCRASCEALIQRAENLKRQIQIQQPSSTRSVKTADPGLKPSLSLSARKRASRSFPVQPEEKLSIKEQTILLKSSKLNGGKYPPLGPGTTPSITDTSEPFTDPFGFLSLSKCQESLLGEWARPHEFLDDPCLFGDGGMFLVQDLITDCSLVASLCAAAAWEVTHHAQIVTNNIFPRTQTEGSRSGKYIVLLHFNGCWRQIVIDDLLPQSRDGKPLHVMSKTNPNLVYPALIEKAFLKVMGGYDFPGSNSATDLHMLTGWIPEVVHLQEDETDLDQLWKKTLRAWSEGDVLATVGTGSLTPAEEKEFGLVGEHNYSIFDIVDRGRRRLLQVRNPWSKGGVPRSSFTTSDLLDALPEGNAETDLAPADPELGTFWVDYGTLSQSFRTLYLNWNPAIFPYSTRKHISFTPSGSDFDVGGNGQYTLSIEGTGEVWILLERHCLGKSEGWEGYIGLAVFPGNERVYSYTRPLYRTEYVDGNHTLLKIPSLPASQKNTILIMANDQNSASPQPPRFFSLTVYAHFPIHITDPLDSLPHEVRVEGVWRKGVSYKSPFSTFVENPQWKLVVPDSRSEFSSASIVALIESKNEETAVNVTIAWSAGKRLARLANQDILCQSGEYVPHNARTVSRNVKLATQYTLIASRFEELSPLEEAFTVILRSNIPIALTPLREEWAGKSRKQITSTWDPDEPCKRFILSTLRLTSFSVRLTAPTSKIIPFVRLSLHEGVNDDSDEGEELVASGEQYTDLSLGQTCSIEGFDLVGREEYILCVERLGAEDNDEEGGEFVLDFLADGELEPIEI